MLTLPFLYIIALLENRFVPVCFNHKKGQCGLVFCRSLREQKKEDKLIGLKYILPMLKSES